MSPILPSRFRACQQGVVLLLMLLVLVISGAAFVLVAFNDGKSRDTVQQELVLEQMQAAKAALLSFLGNSHLFYGNARGPGFLPCPDTDNDEDGLPDCTLPNSALTSPMIGRLPQRLGTGSPDMEFNRYFADVDRQFWYVVSPRYMYNHNTSTNAVNSRRLRDRSSTSATYANMRLSLDGQTGYVALIIAPGEAFETQNRAANPTTASHYIESQDSTFVFRSAASKTTTNDLIIGITLKEFIYAAGMPAAIEMKKELDAQGPIYTTSQTTFRNYLTNAADHAWLKNTSTTGNNGERWGTDTTYVRQTTTTARLNFNGCTGITFLLDYNAGITPSGNSC